MSRLCASLAALLLASAAAAQNCAELSGAARVESDRYVVTYRTRPEKIAVGRHFAMELAVCPRAGQPAPQSVRVDAYMPEHKHGMNYRVTVKPAAAGRYLAEGFLFHMPGRWEWIFEVRGEDTTDRVTRAVMVE